MFPDCSVTQCGHLFHSNCLRFVSKFFELLLWLVSSRPLWLVESAIESTSIWKRFKVNGRTIKKLLWRILIAHIVELFLTTVNKSTDDFYFRWLRLEISVSHVIPSKITYLKHSFHIRNYSDSEISFWFWMIRHFFGWQNDTLAHHL